MFDVCMCVLYIRWDFVVCMYTNQEQLLVTDDNMATFNATIEGCASDIGFDYDVMSECAYGDTGSSLLYDSW